MPKALFQDLRLHRSPLQPPTHPPYVLLLNPGAPEPRNGPRRILLEMPTRTRYAPADLPTSACFDTTMIRLPRNLDFRTRMPPLMVMGVLAPQRSGSSLLRPWPREQNGTSTDEIGSHVGLNRQPFRLSRSEVRVRPERFDRGPARTSKRRVIAASCRAADA